MARKQKTWNPPPVDQAALARALARAQAELQATMASSIRPDEIIQLKLRLPESLRRQIEDGARRSGRSMNSEIIHRLTTSFRSELDKVNLIAKTLLEGLDGEVVEAMIKMTQEDAHANDDDGEPK
jgi:hypothetical protein